MSQVTPNSTVSNCTSNFGPTAFWQIGVLASSYSVILFCGIFYNSAVLFILFSLSKSGWTAVNKLIAYQSLTGLAAITIVVPLYLYMLITGDRNPVLCTLYDWYVFALCAMSCCFIIALGHLRYAYVFHFRFLHHLRQKTIAVMPLVFTFITTVVYVSVRYWLEPPLNKGIRTTLCATRFTTMYKNYWPIVLSSHMWTIVLGVAYFRILRKLRTIVSAKGGPFYTLRKVNVVDARTSALTAIVLEGAILMVQIWNIINPKILPIQQEFFFQELSSMFVHLIHFVPAVLYYVNHQDSHKSLTTVFETVVPCLKRSSEVVVVDNLTIATTDTCKDNP